MAHDVFISYASEDKPIADACCARLEQAGVRCWIAPRDIIPSTDWSASIVDAIAGAKAMVLVFSEHSNVSGQVKREVERAASHGLVILPFRIRDAPLSKHMEYFISTPHWLDALTPPLEKHIERLVETVRLVLAHATAGPAASPAPPRPAAPASPPSPPARGGARRAGLVLAALAALVIAVLALPRIVAHGSAPEPPAAETEPPPSVPDAAAAGAQATGEPASATEPAAPEAQTTAPESQPPTPVAQPAMEVPRQEPASPDGAAGGALAAKAPDLVRRYLETLSSADADAVVSLYDDSADYYGLGRVGREVIRKDKAAYFRAWPAARFELLEIERAVASGDLLEATFRIRFAVENPEKGRRISGTARSVVTWRLTDDGSARIVSDQQKVLSRERTG